MRLRPIYSKTLGSWRICDDLWHERGESSIVATLPFSLDAQKDEKLARDICDRYNAFEEPVETL